MNKILLSIAAVLGLGAGAYYFLPQDQVNQYAQYLPEPVSSFLVKQEVEENQELVSEDEEIVQESNQLNVNANNEISQNAQQEDAQENTTAAQAVQQTQVTQQDEIRDESALTVGQTEQEKGLQSSQQTVESPEPQSQVSNKINSSPEMEKIQKEIEKVQKSISKLDGENEVLQERFQKILRKNRDLAIKLKKIDEQLGETN